MLSYFSLIFCYTYSSFFMQCFLVITSSEYSLINLYSLTANGSEVNDVHSILFVEAPTLVASMNYS